LEGCCLTVMQRGQGEGLRNALHGVSFKRGAMTVLFDNLNEAQNRVRVAMLCAAASGRGGKRPGAWLKVSLPPLTRIDLHLQVPILMRTLWDELGIVVNRA